MKYANNYLLGILIILLITVIITGTYAYNIERDPQKIIESQNQERIRSCLEGASRKSSSEEILQATKACNSDLFSKIISPHNSGSGKVNTGTHSTGTTVLPGGPIKKDTFWIVYDLAIPLIQKYEGLHLNAYPDYKGCSIGWGTRAKSCKESISQSDADNRLGSIVKQVITRVQKNFPTLSDRQQAGLVSFSYNCHKGILDIEKHGLGQHKFWCKTAGGVRLKGLVARRNEEATLLFK